MAGVKLFLSCVSDEFGAYRDALRPACTLARSPIRDPLIEGFSHVVTSMTAPIASGWSESPGGTCTHWKAPPCHSPTSYLILRNINILRHNIQILANIAGRRASRRRHRGCKRRRGRSGAPIKKPGLSTGRLHTMVPLAQRYDVPIVERRLSDLEPRGCLAHCQP